MLALLASSWHLFGGAGWFWHPLAEGKGSTCSATDHSGCGYALWSGSLSDVAEITLITAVLASLAAWWRKHNCHVHRCWRLSWHPHPGHGHPVCSKHHPYGQGRGDHLHPRHHTPDAHASWPAKATDSTPWTAEKPGTAMTWSGSFSSPVPVEVVTPGGVLPPHEEHPGSGLWSPPPGRPGRIRRPGTSIVTPIRKDTA